MGIIILFMIIKYNEGQSSKILITNAEKNPLLKESKIKIIASKDERDEAKKVVDKINELHNIDNEINNWGSFAILYRTHKQSEVFETQLKNSSIPYKIIGKIKFLEREIIVHIISYLRLIINQNDNISLQKIFNYSFSDISLKMKKIFDDADKNQNSYWNIINNLDSYKKKIKKPEKIINFIKFIEFLKEKVTTEEPLYLIEQIVDYINSISKKQNLLFEEEDSKLIKLLKQMTYYLTTKYYNDCCNYNNKNKTFEQKETNEDKKIRCSDSDSDSESSSIFKNKSGKNNENVINNMDKNKEDNNFDDEDKDKDGDSHVFAKYGLKEYLDDLILLNANEDLAENIKDIDTTPNNMMKEKTNNVKLMTIHSSKGLEFNTVFVVGVEKGYYPIFHPSIKDRKKHEEEERRMFYVAITRAKQNCFISYALGRIMGTGKFMKREKSQFIDELENKCLDFSGVNDNNNDFISIDSSSFKHNLFKNYAYSNSQNSYNKYNKYKFSEKKRNRYNKFG
jgi:DNA helicase-2/ATP-dependent DNA helicase PcrA